jgi:hypothetical protein
LIDPMAAVVTPQNFSEHEAVRNRSPRHDQLP